MSYDPCLPNDYITTRAAVATDGMQQEATESDRNTAVLCPTFIAIDEDLKRTPDTRHPRAAAWGYKAV